MITIINFELKKIKKKEEEEEEEVEKDGMSNENELCWGN
jgi:hypothetical protein